MFADLLWATMIQYDTQRDIIDTVMMCSSQRIITFRKEDIEENRYIVNCYLYE